jgi:hypothetical protein
MALGFHKIGLKGPNNFSFSKYGAIRGLSLYYFESRIDLKFIIFSKRSFFGAFPGTGGF